MNRRIIGHACWLVVVISAYFLGTLGWKNRPTGNAEDGSISLGEWLTVKPGDRGERRKFGGSALDNSEVPEESALARVMGLRNRPISDDKIEEFAREAFSDPNPVRRRLAFTRLLESLTLDNAKSIREHLKNGRAGRDEWRDFHYAWGAIAGFEALENGMNTPETDMAHTLTGWASGAPAEAIAWFNSPENEKYRRTDFKQSLVGGLADSDLGLATNFVYELAQGGDKQASELLGIVASEYIRSQGPGASALWAEQLPDGDMKGAAMDRVAHDYVASDPLAAAAWAERFVGEDYAARVIEEVGDEWAERDPSAAVAWLESLEEGKGKSDGMYSAFGEWVRRDPLAASQHLTTMPSSPEKDAAIGGFVSRLAWEDPASAIAWAATISQDSARERSLTRAAQAWFRRDAEAALAWLPSSGLSEAAQKQVLNPPRSRRR